MADGSNNSVVSVIAVGTGAGTGSGTGSGTAHPRDWLIGGLVVCLVH